MTLLKLGSRMMSPTISSLNRFNLIVSLYLYAMLSILKIEHVEMEKELRFSYKRPSRHSMS